MTKMTMPKPLSIFTVPTGKSWLKSHLKTYSAGSFVFKGTTLDYILYSEGIFQINGTNTYYHFHIKDNLGNARLEVNATKTIVDQCDYYPFGMLMTKKFSGGLNNLYKYNVKELQDDQLNDTALDWYDYGARFYDASLGRWFVADPLAEKYPSNSPYVYCINNPLRFIDLNGEEPTVYEAALMAKHVYGDKVVLAGGWSQTKPYNNSNSGLQSALYQCTTSHGVTEYAYVSAGTQITDLGDIKEDVGQVFGNVDQI